MMIETGQFTVVTKLQGSQIATIALDYLLRQTGGKYNCQVFDVFRGRSSEI